MSIRTGINAIPFCFAGMPACSKKTSLDDKVVGRFVGRNYLVCRRSHRCRSRLARRRSKNAKDLQQSTDTGSREERGAEIEAKNKERHASPPSELRLFLGVKLNLMSWDSKASWKIERKASRASCEAAGV